MEEEPELCHYVCMYKHKWSKHDFEKCFAHSARSGPRAAMVGGSSITLTLLGFWATKARRGNEENLGITNKVAVEEPR